MEKSDTRKAHEQECRKKLEAMFYGSINFVPKARSIKKLTQAIDMCDGANGNPYVEDWFYTLHDRLEQLDPISDC